MPPKYSFFSSTESWETQNGQDPVPTKEKGRMGVIAFIVHARDECDNVSLNDLFC